MPHPSSVATRYLLARLRPLSRPIFWGPAIVLMLMLLFTWEFWMRDWSSYLGVDRSTPDANALSQEDKAIGADIDTLPVLLNDFGMTSVAENATEAAKPKEAARPVSLADLQGVPIAGASGGGRSPSADMALFGKLEPLTASPQTFGGANVASSDRLLPSGQLAGATPQAAGTTSQPSSPLDNLLVSAAATNTASQSPLQAALARYATPANASVSSTVPASPSGVTATSASAPPSPIAGTTSLGSFGVNAAPNSAVNAYTSLVEGAQPLSGVPSSASGVAAPPIAPPVAQPILANPALGVGQPLPTQGLGASPDALTPQATPQSTEIIPSSNLPMSAPRPIPNRFIGGGKINTFSNP